MYSHAKTIDVRTELLAEHGINKQPEKTKQQQQQKKEV